VNGPEVARRDAAAHDGVRRGPARPGVRHGSGADAQRLAQVLAGLEFPAAKWQIVIHAEHYGADAASRGQLWTLVPQTYPDLASVFAALGITDPGGRVRRRPPRARVRRS
jgi:hypothetical protein